LDVESKSVAEEEKQQAALSSVFAAVLLTVLKLVVGLLTGSLGILSEAAHSGLDLVAALVTFFAVRFSDRPPDVDHPYGHGKIENLSALVETLLLLITCVWITYEAVQRLFFESVEIEVNVWAFAVMGVSIIVDISRSRILYRAARKYDSQALEADAIHFSTDVWSSSVVIVGLALVWLSQRLGPEWAWLAKADAVAALGVALIVIYVGLRLGRRAVDVLLDTAPPGLAEKVLSSAKVVPGVQTVGPVRVRKSGASTFVDLSVTVDRSVPLQKAHEIATAVENKVSSFVDRGDVLVHVDPTRSLGESLPQIVGTIASGMGLRTHHVHAHEVRGHYFVDLHVEVPVELTLVEAHEQVNHLEAAIRTELPYIRDINSHMEPVVAVPAIASTLTTEEEAHLRDQIVAAVNQVPGLGDSIEFHIRPEPGGYDVVLHCRADPALSLAEAHQLADDLEKRLEVQVPEISQALVHVEPDEEGSVT
jgi:cation diffusion facilitator family transporter